MRKFLKQKCNILMRSENHWNRRWRLEMTYSGNNEISLKRSLYQDRTWSNRFINQKDHDLLSAGATIKGTQCKSCWLKSSAIKIAIKSCVILIVCWYSAQNFCPHNTSELLSGQNKHATLKVKLWLFSSECVLTLDI